MKRTLAACAAVAVLAGACSSDDAGTTTESTVPETTTTTVAPSTTTAPTTTDAPAVVSGEDPDVDAVILAYDIVFSSQTTFEEKAPYLTDPTGLEDTVVQYMETGESMGGVELLPTSVTIADDTAAVTYDLLFGGTPTYPDLTGDAVRVDDTWKITREMFCAMMSSARVGCPDA
ncbi:MAG: hypothetical protein ABFS21_04915 [Actinomycetota bacterium]